MTTRLHSERSCAMKLSARLSDTILWCRPSTLFSVFLSRLVHLWFQTPRSSLTDCHPSASFQILLQLIPVFSNKSISSANFWWLILGPCTEIPVPFSFIVPITRSFRYEMKFVGDNGSPCRVYRLCHDSEPVSQFSATSHCWLCSLLIFYGISTSLVPTTYNLKVVQITSCLIK